MIENSYIKDRKISKSMSRLNNISTDKKFRVKSLRMKTQQKTQNFSSQIKKPLNLPILTQFKQCQDSTQSLKKLDSQHLTSSSIQLSTLLLNKKLRVKSSLLQKDFQQLLIQKLKIPQKVIEELFTLKLQQQKIKTTQQKYFQFCKNFYNRLYEKVEINVEGFNFRTKALERFLNFYIQWQEKDVIGLDLSFCSQLVHQVKTKQQQQDCLIQSKNSNNKNKENLSNQDVSSLWPKNNILTRLILEDQKLMKLSLRNIHISPQQMVDILTCCLKSKRIYSLDISNKNSQTINRIGTQSYYLQAFFAKNQYVGVVKMDNLNVTDDSVQKISNGISKSMSNNNPLKILSLANNILTQKSLNCIFALMKSGITQLNLSNNHLGSQFFMAIQNLRGNTVKNLDLSSVGMNSESLVHFLQQICENKNLQILKLDHNDFSHHWFNKIKDVFQSGISVQYLSLSSCGIKNFDDLFQGLTHSKSLRRLNLNYNLVNIQDQQIEKVAECLKINKYLQQLKIRFCGYNESILIQLLQAIQTNKALEIIDISQNHMSDQGGKVILKTLNQNKSLKDMGIQKLQFTVRMTEQIQKLLAYNKQVRQKQNFIHLIDQNKKYKAKDTFTWTDIEKIEAQVKKIQVFINEAKLKKNKLETKIQKKKQFIVEMRRQYKEEQKKLDRQIKREEHMGSSANRKIDLQIQKIAEKQLAALEFLQIQENLINALQLKIMKENEKIKKRQNLLEDQLRDEKYLQRRKQNKEKGSISGRGTSKGDIEIAPKQKDKNMSKIFDNTKGIPTQSKRKNSVQPQSKKI